MGSYIEQRKEKKQKTLSLYAEGLSGRRISKILSISKSTVYRWIANFAEENEKDMSAKRKNTKESKIQALNGNHIPDQIQQGKKPSQPSDPSETESAEQKIARLEKELRDAQLRADFYEEMINVAEKKFDIQIRKKAGAKR